MKKNVLFQGLVYLLAGMAFLILGIFGPQVSYEGLFWGLAGAGVGPGLALIGKYLYYSRPAMQGVYEEKIKNEKIEMRDERRIMLRDKAGNVMYKILISLLVVLLFILSLMKIFAVYEINKYVIISLSGFLLLQFFLLNQIYQYYDKKL